ncbi:uncharacterized protein A4U43_C08F31240 [Asparagus officinalis]|nr:uncharacterized protein A4U43_C08F31240 [Asparagus officinalis]
MNILDVYVLWGGLSLKPCSNKNKKTVDPFGQVPEYVVQTISQKVEQELKKKFEAQKADLVHGFAAHGFAALLTETLGQTIDLAAIARLVACTRSPEGGNSDRNHDRPRSSRSSHHPRNEIPSHSKTLESFSPSLANLIPPLLFPIRATPTLGHSD